MPTFAFTHPAHATAGIGLRSPHVAEVLDRHPPAGWFEVHAENYMTRGVAAGQLERVRQNYNLSIHGVGLSLGSAKGIDTVHLGRLKEVAVKLPQPEIHIRGDRDARYDFVGRVVFACQRAGILKIGFITEPPARNGSQQAE